MADWMVALGFGLYAAAFVIIAAVNVCCIIRNIHRCIQDIRHDLRTGKHIKGDIL